MRTLDLKLNKLVDHAGILCALRAAENEKQRVVMVEGILKHFHHARMPGLAHMLGLLFYGKLLKFGESIPICADYIPILFVHKRGKQLLLAGIIAVERTGRDSGGFNYAAKRG